MAEPAELLQNVTCLVRHMSHYQKEINEAGNAEAAENDVYTLIDTVTLNQLELTGETKCQSYSLPLCALCEGKQPMTWIKDLSDCLLFENENENEFLIF